MKGVVFHGPQDLRFENTDDPQLNSSRDIIVKVEKCSICGSDLHVYNGKKLGPVDYSNFGMEFCVGHEGIGEVVEVGKNIHTHKVGDRVLMAGGVGCGKCEACLRGAFNLCTAGTTMAYGFSPLLQGMQAEYALVKKADLSALKIPEGVTDAQALLLTDSLATGFLGASKANVKPGASVAIIGLGPIGKMALESALALGAEKVYAIEPSPLRRKNAEALGATSMPPEGAVELILQETNGRGVDCVIEAVGKDETIQAAIKVATRGGNLAILGLIERGMKSSLMAAQLKSLTVFAGVAGVADSWAELVPLVQEGKITGVDMFSHEFDLADAAKAFELFNEGKDSVMKVMVKV